MPYTWILFDADGTLFDYERAEAQALARVLSDLVPELPAGYLQRYRQINERLWRAFEQGRTTPARIKSERFARLLRALQIEADPVAVGRQYLRYLAEGTELIEGALDVLDALRGRFQLALITNGLSEVQRPRLERAGLWPYFAVVTISEEVGASKPDPAIFDLLFAQMGPPPKEEVLIVGDGLTSDIQGGCDYGIDTCWFNPRQEPRPEHLEITYEIASLSQLLPLLE